MGDRITGGFARWRH